jgi:glycosyltransferase involved in cell wall biosynthesis
MKLVYITAGAAGMYCGSCMRDNTLVRALSREGVKAVLVPTYTPILADVEDASDGPIFYGGIGVVLAQKLPLWRLVPRWVSRALAAPFLLRLVSKLAVANRPEKLGELALSVLRGEDGRQRRELEELGDWIETQRPDVVHLTNSLFAGLAPYLRRRLMVPIVCTLQGEDIFLEGLEEPHRGLCLAAIREGAAAIDAFVAVSAYCGRRMADLAGLDESKITAILPAIPPEVVWALRQARPEPAARAAEAAGGEVVIGFLARLAREKGVELLVDAFIELRRRPGTQDIRLRLAGYLHPRDRALIESLRARLDAKGLGADVEILGTVDFRGKVQFLGGLDIFCVPAVFPEPKGLYVLEAFAAGLPVVLPAHGSFPELVEAVDGGGLLVEPDSAHALANGLHRLAFDPALRRDLGERARTGFFTRFSDERMARATLEVYRSLTPAAGAPRSAGNAPRAPLRAPAPPE